MEIRKLEVNEPEDFIRLIEIFRKVFDHDVEIPHPDHLVKVLSNTNFMVFVVKLNHKVVGGLTLYTLPQYYSIQPLAYIYDVGIDPDFQRRGLGKSLLNEVCNFCKANGFDSAYVEAEYDDLDAVRFYRRTNYSSEMQAIHFTYSFNNI